jgi:alpha-beta hydrolase superfamily lysophospholipase
MNRGVPARGPFTLRLLTLAVLVVAPVPAFAAAGVCTDFDQSTGAKGRICMPYLPWNGDLVVFAHGYVSPLEPVAIPEDQLALPGGTSLPDIANGLGFAFATTSYHKNGLAVVQGLDDVADLVSAFPTYAGSAAAHVYLIGASEGGLVAALGVERSPETYSGGVATCGPIGNFRRQIDYWGDFRVLFDYFFPGLIPGTAVSVPDEVRTNWGSVYAPRIAAAFAARPAALAELIRVGRAAYDPANPATMAETALGLLWYSAFATEDGKTTLGGQPFDNTMRFYVGSSNDFRLNRLVERYRADLPAVQEVEADYQTSGRLDAPLVTMHTTGDPIVPYWHEPLYTLKALFAGSGLRHVNLPVLRYGHCNFQPAEALVALGLLVLQVEGREMLNAESVLSSEQARAQFRVLARESGLRR